MPNASRPRRLPRLRRFLALATGNWLSRGYLAALAASVLVVLLFPDSGFALGPLMLTAPLSFLSMALPFGPGTEGGGAVEVLATGFWAVWLLLCFLVNAAVLGALVARVRDPRTGRRLLFGVSFGRADQTAPVNGFRMGRVPLEQSVALHGTPGVL